MNVVKVVKIVRTSTAHDCRPSNLLQLNGFAACVCLKEKFTICGSVRLVYKRGIIHTLPQAKLVHCIGDFLTLTSFSLHYNSVYVYDSV